MNKTSGRLLAASLLFLFAGRVIHADTRAIPAKSPATKGESSKRMDARAEAYDEFIGDDPSLSKEEKSKIIEDMQSAPVFRNTFLGIRTLQNPADAWILMELLWETKPDLFVEAGTFHGGSAALWAIILEHINPQAEVITIDIKDHRPPHAKELPIVKKRVTFLLGSSTDKDVVAEVHRRAKGKKVIVMLDSLHSEAHVAAELAAYAPLIPVGGYLVVQDTMVGPIKAIKTFLAENPNWEADRSRERYEQTSTVGGYLHRLR